MTKDGEEDGFVIQPGWSSEVTPNGETRIAVSVPLAELAGVHAALVGALKPPVGFLYRQRIDRKKPRPQGAPPRDMVALGLDPHRVRTALANAAPLVYGDARCEVWLRGALGEQLILDQDGLLFCYPDDPTFRDALAACGVPADDVVTIADRDYVKHWFHAEVDALEDQLIRELRLAEVPTQG